MSTCPRCGYEDPDALRAGDTLYGYCGGEFGRDSYEDKKVLAIGATWVLVQYGSGATATRDGDPQELAQYRVKRCWSCDEPVPAGGECLNGCDGG